MKRPLRTQRETGRDRERQRESHPMDLETIGVTEDGCYTRGAERRDS